MVGGRLADRYGRLFRSASLPRRHGFLSYPGGRMSCRVVEVVRARVELGGEQRDALLRPAQVAQRARHLDDRAPAPLTGQPGAERTLVERDGQVGVPGGVQRGGPLEEPVRVAGRQLVDQLLHDGEEAGLVPLVDRRPRVGHPLLPVRRRHGRQPGRWRRPVVADLRRRSDHAEMAGPSRLSLGPARALELRPGRRRP
jgi:hypothetical protein